MFLWNLTAHYQAKSTEELLRIRKKFRKSIANEMLIGIGIGYILLYGVLSYLDQANFAVGFTLWGGFVAILCVPMDNQIRINKINGVLRQRGYED